MVEVFAGLEHNRYNN